MAKAAPVLLLGNQRVGADPEQQLMTLAGLWWDVTEIGAEVRDLNRRVNVQNRWLDANKGHPLWAERAMHARIVNAELLRAMDRVHVIAQAANRLTDEMSPHTKEIAAEHVHAWAGMGSAAIYALTWRLVPNKQWLDDAAVIGERLKKNPCPF